MGLQSQVAKLRSAVEKGEANRQKLEYDMTIANRAASQDKRAAADRENALQKTNASLKGALSAWCTGSVHNRGNDYGL